MARANWKRRVGLGILAAGLAAWGAASASDRTLTVHEPGQPALRCRVVQSWTEPNGSRVHQVQALTTGEMLTVVETRPASGPPVGGQPIATQIYHWGDAKTPPIGSPVPPRTSTAAAPATTAVAPVAAAGHVASPPADAASPRSTVHRSFRSLGSVPVTKPAQPAAPVSAIPREATPAAEPAFDLPADSAPRPTAPSTPARLTPVATTPVPTVLPPTGIVEPAPVQTTSESPRGRSLLQRTGPAAPPTATPLHAAKSVATSTSHIRPPQVQQIPVPKMGGSTASSVAPAAASDSVVSPPPTLTTTVIECESCEERQPGLLNRWLANRSVPTPAPMANKGPAIPGESTPSVPKPVVKSEMAEPAPTDWRQSWGKVTPGAEPAAPLPRPVPPRAAARPAARPTTPTAKATSSDPLESPALFSRVNVPGVRETEKSKVPPVAGSPTPLAAASATPPVAPAHEPKTQAAVPTATPVADTRMPASPTPMTPPAGPVTPAAVPAQPTPKAVEVVKQTLATPSEATPAPMAPPASMSAATVLSPKSPRPSVYSLLTNHRPAGTPAPPTAPVRPRAGTLPPGVPPGMRSRIAAEIAAAELAQEQAQGVPSVSISAFEGNAFSPGLQPTAQPGMAQPSGPAGGNAFAAGDFVPPQGLMQNPNAFLAPTPGQQRMMPQNAPGQMGMPVAATVPPVVPPSQHLWILRESLQPSQREQAVHALLAGPARTQPEVVQALRASAQGDPAPSVRASCLRALARVQANDPTTLAIVQAARADGDLQVRNEAELALRALTSDSAVRPVSHTRTR